MKYWVKQKVINYLLSKVVRVTIPEDVITQNKKINKILLGGIELTDIEVRALNAEAKALENMRLWSIINETIKQQCYERGWRDSTTIEQLNTAKTMYNVLDTQKSIVNSFKGMIK
jgi:hypothetical protein